MNTDLLLKYRYSCQIVMNLEFSQRIKGNALKIFKCSMQIEKESNRVT